MRRAEERRSASVMIRSSIRWSLAGYDVDWMMKASEPRTFSWISTKISMSAKRRTTALVSGKLSPPAIACASAGLELPATSLMEPFLPDIEAPPRILLDTTFSISGFLRNRPIQRARRYQAGGRAGNPFRGVFLPKPLSPDRYLRGLPVGIAKRAGPKRPGSGRGRLGARDRRPPLAGAGRRLRVLGRCLDHGGQPAQPGLRDFSQHEVISRSPGVTQSVAAALAGRFLPGKPQGALLIAVVDVPDPCDYGFAANGLRREIAADAVRGRVFARDDGEAAQFGFAVEHAHHPLEHRRRRTVDRFERDGGAVAAGHRERAARSTVAGAATERASRRQQERGHGCAKGRPARPDRND